MFDCTPVFYANMQSTAKVVTNQGGTSSSKTYSIVQLLFKYATDGRCVITITGESIPNLKKGAYRDAETIFGSSQYLQNQVVSWNKTDRIIYFKNGSIMEFTTNLDEQSAKSGKRDYLFVNEANGVSWLIFWQLAIRTRKQIFIDYNPTVSFWAHEKLIGTTPETNELSATVQLIISDHRHNTFLSEEDHRKIEGIKNKDLWWVYARGRTGNLTGLIYPNWIMIPQSEYPKEDKFTGGIDFGYTNDPSAGVKKTKIANKIFFDQMFYECALPPRSISQILKAEGFRSSNLVFCEHHPEMINELRKNGIQATKASKGPGSLNAGIERLKDHDVYYTERSVDIKMEISKYMWQKDPVTGKSTNAPIDAFNHLLDACRYSEFTNVQKL